MSALESFPRKSSTADRWQSSGRRKRHNPVTFPVVGIGASAGGIEALQTFVQHLPEQCGMAFVVVQHLPANGESHLTDLLQRTTAHPVLDIEDGQRVQPDHIYILQPNHDLTIQDGILGLAPPVQEQGDPSVIDRFFQQLAEDQEEQAAGILLSGMGSDGALGLQAISDCGGLTLVQSPAEADFDDMPNSAIELDIVDFVGPVEEVIEHLMAFQPEVTDQPLPEDNDDFWKDDSEIFSAILSQVREFTGHDFRPYKRSTLLRRLERRMQLNDLSTLADYLHYLYQKPQETHRLYEDFLITVTNFFRDAASFRALEQRVIPKLFQEKQKKDQKQNKEQIRVWVPGCATGEEAYSLAISLLEHASTIENAPEIQIFATDVDEDALAVARKGIYPSMIADDVSPKRLSDFFSPEGEDYRINDQVRDMILFTRHNLLQDPPFSKLDLISCRNLLIYLNRDTQKRIMEIFHYALNARGFLFLGSSETAEITSTFFTDYEPRHRLFRRKDAAITPLPLVHPSSGTQQEEYFVEEEPGREMSDPEKLYQAWRLKRYTPPSFLIDAEYNILHIYNGAGQFLQEHDGPVSYNVLQKILPELRLDLRTALYQAFQHRTRTSSRFLQITRESEIQTVRFHVGPVDEPGFPHDYVEVVFEIVDKANEELLAHGISQEDVERSLLIHMEEELLRTREQLQATIEEYETSNEELQASNEELQSMNVELRSTTEELETSREELQSVNEELVAVNQQLQTNIEELSHANNDLQNLIESTDIGTIFLDRSLQVKRFTPRATDLFNLLPSDIGRPFGHISHRFVYDNLNVDVEQVLAELASKRLELQSINGRWFILRIFPYRTIEDKIDGVVLTFVDVTALKQAEQTVAQRAKQQATVADLGQFALENTDIDLLYHELVHRIADVLDVEMCKVLEIAPGQQKLLLKEGVGWKDGCVGRATVGTDKESQAGYTLHAVEPVVVEDLRTETRFHGPDLLLEHDVVSGLSVVIRGTKQVYGVLGVHTKERRTFTQDDINFVEATANVLAQTLDHHRAQQALAQANAELEARITERTQELTEANQKLRIEVEERKKAQERFYKAFHVNPAASAIASLTDLRYLNVNASFMAITGFTEEEILGRTGAEIGLRVDDERSGHAIEKLRAGTALRFEEYRIRTKSGEIRHVLAAAEPIEMDGQPCLLGMMLDITERRQAEEELRKSQKLLSEAEEIATMGSWEWDALNNNLYWSPSLYRIYGVSPAEVTASYEDFLALVHPDDRDMVQEHITRALQDHQSFTFTHRIIRPDGDTRILQARGQVTVNDEGQPVRMVGTGQDITQRKAIEDALHLSEQRLSMAIEVSGAGIFEHGFSTEIDSYYSERFAEIVGYKQNELPPFEQMQDWWFKQIHPDDGQALIQAYQMLSEGQITDYDVELRVRHKKGSWIHIRSLAHVASYDDTGNATRVVGVIQDITELKQRESELRVHQEHLQEMVEARTAELETKARELLEEVTERKRAESQLLTLNETLEERVLERTQQVLNLASALTLAEQRERQRIAGILHDHLQQVLYALLFRTQLFHESTAEQRTELLPQFRTLVEDAIATTRTLTVDLSPPILAGEGLVEAVNWLVEQMAEIYQLRVSLTVEDRPPNLTGEIRVLLFHLIRELLFNVVKHAETDQATIKISLEDEHLCIVAEDQGIGFDPETAYERKQKEGGWGLFSIRERLNLFGGRLNIQSAPGKGTRITIIFPLEGVS
jgi:two-component system, chemotaxis family, CheB/CheR fusion protein